MLKRYKRVLAVLAGTTMIVSSMTACGSSGDTKSTGSNSEYPELNLSMAVNGTDTQIDTQVGQKLAELVSEKSGGNITIDVFPNDTLAGGNATKGIEYVCAGSTDLAAYAIPLVTLRLMYFQMTHWQEVMLPRELNMSVQDLLTWQHMQPVHCQRLIHY